MDIFDLPKTVMKSQLFTVHRQGCQGPESVCPGLINLEMAEFSSPSCLPSALYNIRPIELECIY